MKVTKAKGLNTDLNGSSGCNPRTATVHLMRSLAAGTPLPRKSVLRAERAVFVGCCHGSEPDRIEPLCFGNFHLGPQMKVARQPGETGALSRSEQS
ncbi:MAG TPA: hypothetical protein VIY30_13315 [Burkholderiaceae bacterium]